MIFYPVRPLSVSLGLCGAALFGCGGSDSGSGSPADSANLGGMASSIGGTATSSSAVGGANGSGGSTATAGNSALGGSLSLGGASASGGSVSPTGGSPTIGSGGTTVAIIGGSSSTGGAWAGGSSGSGASSGSSGALGGSLELGGTTSEGGTAATGGTSGETSYLSDWCETSSSNGWGPVEHDSSNGEEASGDGSTLTIAGVGYAKGLGVHAASELVYALEGGCSSLHAAVGIDDETAGAGTVTFQIYGDGTLLYQSNSMTGGTAADIVDISVAGVSQLALVTTDAGDGNGRDHADWADLQVTCNPTPDSCAIGGSGGSSGTGGATGISGSGGSPNTGGTAGTGGSPATTPATVWVAGDSTVRNSSPCRGWGDELYAYFNDNITVVNSALAGRSVRDWLYFATGEMDGDLCLVQLDANGQPLVQDRWAYMLENMSAGDYLLIQFGINDGWADCGSHVHVGEAEFQLEYGMMADAAKARGTQPVFLTPVSAIACSGGTAVGSRGYLDATRQAGANYDVPVIDLHQLSVDLYNQLAFCPVQGGDVSAETTGPVGDFFCNDHTHFETTGANGIAGVIVQALEDQGIGLSAYRL